MKAESDTNLTDKMLVGTQYLFKCFDMEPRVRATKR